MLEASIQESKISGGDRPIAWDGATMGGADLQNQVTLSTLAVNLRTYGTMMSSGDCGIKPGQSPIICRGVWDPGSLCQCQQAHSTQNPAALTAHRATGPM